MMPGRRLSAEKLWITFRTKCRCLSVVSCILERAVVECGLGWHLAHSIRRRGSERGPFSCCPGDLRRNGTTRHRRDGEMSVVRCTVCFANPEHSPHLPEESLMTATSRLIAATRMHSVREHMR